MGRKKSDIVSGYGLRETVDYRIADEMLALHSILKKKGKEDSEEEKAMQQARALFNIK
jgi:hypothetical protein